MNSNSRMIFEIIGIYVEYPRLNEKVCVLYSKG